MGPPDGQWNSDYFSLRCELPGRGGTDGGYHEHFCDSPERIEICLHCDLPDCQWESPACRIRLIGMK